MKDISCVEAFIKGYSALTKENLESVMGLYHEDFLFEDPIQVCNGWDEYHHHLTEMYKNATDCRFIIKDWLYDNNHAFLQWTLCFCHPKLFSGIQQEVEGCTRLELQEGLISYQRDFFDCGEMIYEGVPLLRTGIRLIKARLTR